MAILKYKDLEKMEKKEIKSKILDLKKETIKARVSAGKEAGKNNSKEIRKAIARLNTKLNELNKKVAPKEGVKK